MRRLINVATVLLLSLAMAASATAQVRGRGRLQGVVTDKATGKPIEGANVTLMPATENTQPILVKTDRKGHWSALGLTGGNWNIDIAASGYDQSRGSASVSELQMSPMIKTALAPVIREETIPAPQVATPLIPNEAVTLIDEGQKLLRLQPGETVTAADGTNRTMTTDDLKANAKRAVTNFEQAFPMVPADREETKEIRNQLQQVMAQAYYRAGDLPKAITMLEQVNFGDPAADPALMQRSLLLVNLYLENGDLEKGKALLEKLPSTVVTDPTVYTNIGILFLNKRKPSDALTYFGRAVELDPKRAESYYYRGLAALQLKRNKDAKADFEQVIALAPNSSEASDAKQYLVSLK